MCGACYLPIGNPVTDSAVQCVPLLALKPVFKLCLFCSHFFGSGLKGHHHYLESIKSLNGRLWQLCPPVTDFATFTVTPLTSRGLPDTQTCAAPQAGAERGAGLRGAQQLSHSGARTGSHGAHGPRPALAQSSAWGCRGV